MSLGFSGSIFRSGLFEYTPRRVCHITFILTRPFNWSLFCYSSCLIHIGKVMCNKYSMV